MKLTTKDQTIESSKKHTGELPPLSKKMRESKKYNKTYNSADQNVQESSQNLDDTNKNDKIRREKTFSEHMQKYLMPAPRFDPKDPD